MKLRSSIASVAAVFAVALVVFMMASTSPVTSSAFADGHGTEPVPQAEDTTGSGDDSTITMPSSPTIDDNSVIDWVIEAVDAVL